MENKNRTYSNMSWFIYILIGVVGFFVVRFFFDELKIASAYEYEKLSIYVYYILILLYGFVTCGLVYNGGKLIFGLLCGYELVYFNFYFIGIYKKNGKLKLCWGGKYEYVCKVCIAPKKEKVNVVLPLLGGTIATIFALAVTYLLIFLLNTSATDKFFFLVSSMLYVFMVFISMVPFRMDTLNDGFTLVLLKNKQYRDVYLNNLKNLLVINDTNKEFIYQDLEVVNNPINLEAQVYNYYYLLEKGNVVEAMELMSKCYQYKSNVILEEHVNTITIAKTFDLCLKKNNEELKEFYFKADSTTKHLINEGKKLEGIKTALYVFTYIDEDKEGYAKVINDVNKVKQKYPYSRFVSIEENFIKDVIKDVQENKPEWNA